MENAATHFLGESVLKITSVRFDGGSVLAYRYTGAPSGAIFYQKTFQISIKRSYKKDPCGKLMKSLDYCVEGLWFPMGRIFTV